MGFPHETDLPRTHGRSPGNGITPMLLSRDPLATEGEATPGPVDENPYDVRERELAAARDPPQPRGINPGFGVPHALDADDAPTLDDLPL